MQDCETINLNEYTLSGEGGTAITYKHNSRNSFAPGITDQQLAKLLG